MNLLLNIGLARKNKPNVKSQQVIAELLTAGFVVRSHTTLSSDTEPTVVASVKAPSFLVEERVAAISCALSQDCIAVYNPETCKGTLLGPRAAAWGDFNPEYFLLLNGERLARPLQAAA